MHNSRETQSAERVSGSRTSTAPVHSGRMSLGSCALFLMMLASSIAAAQSNAPLPLRANATVAVQNSMASPLVQNDSTGWHPEQCLGGLTYGAPLKLAASWAGGLRKELANGQDVCAFVSPKIGLGGARLGAGFARTTGTFGGGYAGSVAIIRTFGSPSYADRQSTYAGGSLHYFPLLGIGLELGWYKRLGGVNGRGREAIIAWSAGIGF